SPRRAELPVLVIAGEQSADHRLATPLARHPAADHDLLGAGVLDLHPRGGPPSREVWAVEPLRDDALEAALRGGGQQRSAVAAVIGGRLPAISHELEPL